MSTSAGWSRKRLVDLYLRLVPEGSVDQEQRLAALNKRGLHPAPI